MSVGGQRDGSPEAALGQRRGNNDAAVRVRWLTAGAAAKRKAMDKTRRWRSKGMWLVSFVNFDGWKIKATRMRPCWGSGKVSWIVR